VLLLNSTPNTDGRIPEDDKARYRELGEAIERNFTHPLAVATNVSAKGVELDLGGTKQINCADLWEEYRIGHRIRAYVVEGHVNGVWVKLAQGTAVGRRKLDLFAPVTADRVRVRVTQAIEAPIIRRFQVHQVDAELVKVNAPPLKHE
jgi:alpha-L-fucosidase